MIRSEESRKRMSEARKAYFARISTEEKALLYTPERNKKISIARKKTGAPWMKNRKVKQETIEKIIKANKGRKATKETRLKLSIAHMGIETWNKGKILPQFSDENSANWKGDNAGYRSLHIWVQKHLGKADHCSFDFRHKSTRFHWANRSRQYKRNLEDWISLCPSCHFKADRRGVSL